MNTRLRDAFSFFFLLAPAIALVGANIHFRLLADRTGLFNVNVFTLQDHFDKAVDLMIPVFLLFGLSISFVILLAERSIDEDKKKEADGQKKKKRSIRRERLLGIVLAFGVSYLVPGTMRWLALIIILTVALQPIVAMLSDYAEQKVQWESDSTYFRLSFVMFLSAGMLTGLGMNLEGSVNSAAKSHWATEKRIIFDRISSGYIVIDEGQFRLTTESGDLVFSGAEIPEKISSGLCRDVGGWTCIGTQNLTPE